MKLSVRAKVANGLVIFLLIPRAAETAVHLFETYSDGLNPFAADDKFELVGDKGNIAFAATVHADPAGDPSGGDPSGCDPSGFDPTGYDPSVLIVNAPIPFVTAEDGSSDSFQVSMAPDPRSTRYFQFVSKPYGDDPSGCDPSGGDPSGGEAQAMPSAVAFNVNACVPQTIQVIGLNDGIVDGDRNYCIDTLNELGTLVDRRVGVNLDNDSYPDIAVDIQGPFELPDGGKGVFMIRARNVSKQNLAGNDFLIESTPGLDIKKYAASLLSGNKFKNKGKIAPGVLIFTNVDLDAGDMLLISIDVVMNKGGQGNNKITARFSSSSGEQQNDDDQIVRISLP